MPQRGDIHTLDIHPMNLIRMALTCFLRCCSPFFEASLTRRLPGLLRCSSSTETEVVSGGRRVVICQRLVFEAHGLLYNTPGPSLEDHVHGRQRTSLNSRWRVRARLPHPASRTRQHEPGLAPQS